MVQNIKEVFSYGEVREKILSGVKKLSEPVIQTISPKGRNVLFEGADGDAKSSNDGFTIAKEIILEDPIENTAANAIKQAAFRTNQEVGDATSTTILEAKVMVEEGFKLIDSGWNPMTLKRAIEKTTADILKEVRKMKREVKTPTDIGWIANISANNDKEIAADVVDIVTTAGLKGAVLLEDNRDPKTEIIKEQGFVVESGLAYSELSNQKGRNEAQYKEVKVLVTDKRIYYANDALAIMKVVQEAGFNTVVIVARDFIGVSPNVFITNHKEGKMNVVLIKDKTAGDNGSVVLEDLAQYLGTEVVSEKKGDLTKFLKITDFATAGRVVSNQLNSLIVASKPNPALKYLTKQLETEIKKVKSDTEKKKLERRLANLTNGVVTVRIGGNTQIEMVERIYRYEDAINAARRAMEHGYVIGGGITLYKAFYSTKIEDRDISALFDKVTKASIRQIAINCDAHYPTVLENIKDGKTVYNALTGEFEDINSTEVIEPLLATEQALKNATSAATQILSSGYMIVYKRSDEEKVKNK